MVASDNGGSVVVSSIGVATVVEPDRVAPAHAEQDAGQRNATWVAVGPTQSPACARSTHKASWSAQTLAGRSLLGVSVGLAVGEMVDSQSSGSSGSAPEPNSDPDPSSPNNSSAPPSSKGPSSPGSSPGEDDPRSLEEGRLVVSDGRCAVAVGVAWLCSNNFTTSMLRRSRRVRVSAIVAVSQPPGAMVHQDNATICELADQRPATPILLRTMTPGKQPALWRVTRCLRRVITLLG